MKLLTLFLAVSWLFNDATAIRCQGERNLEYGHGMSCMTHGHGPIIGEKQSCLAREHYKKDDMYCIANSCTEINIKLVPGVFNDSENMIWSYSSCFKPTMDIEICAGEHPPELTSTTWFSSSTGSEGTGSTIESNFTAAESNSTTAEMSSTTTTATLTSTTISPLGLKEFSGCYKGEVEFNCAKCEPKTVRATLTDDEGGDAKAEVMVMILGCCSERDCKLPPPKSQKNKCYYGKDGDYYTVECSSECYGYVHVSKDGKETSSSGCLADLSNDAPFESSITCSKTYLTGMCNTVKDGPAKGETACLRCCTSKHCNIWETRTELLTETKTEGGQDSFAASASVPSPIVLAVGWILCQMLLY